MAIYQPKYGQMGKGKRLALFIPSFEMGGVEKVFVTLANSFVLKGYSVDILVHKREGQLLDYLNHDVQIVELKGRRLRNCFGSLFRYLRRSNVNVLITGPTYPNLMSIVANLLLFKKVKLFVTHHNFQDIEMEGLGIRGLLMPSLISFFYRHAAGVVAVSDSLKYSLIQQMNLIPAKVHRIYNPVIDTDFYEKANSYYAKQFLPKEFENYIISVGRLEKVKNISILLQAFSKLISDKKYSDFKLVVVGDGEERMALEKEAQQLDLDKKMLFAGMVNNPLPLIKGAKLFVQTSFSESFSMVTIEALALNVPIVATMTEGVTEILNNGLFGVLVPINDLESLVHAIKSQLDNYEEIDIKAYLNQFTDSGICDEYLNLISGYK